MMRSMFSGVSGLRSHQSRMDVIGNNIANVNTVGFKSGRTTFQEIFSQTIKGAGAPDAATGRGGTNPMQVGLGVNVGAIDTMMNRGSVQRTDNPTDMSIDGEGFFVVRAGNSPPLFTRAGNFGIDKQGNLITADGLSVQGWQDYGGGPQPSGNYVFDTGKPPESINLYSDSHNGNKKIIAAQATTQSAMAGNLDASVSVPAATAAPPYTPATVTPPPAPTATNGVPNFIMPMTIYDELGNSYQVNVNFTKSYVDNTVPATPYTEWYYEIPNTASLNVGSMAAAPSGATQYGFIRFDSSGIIDTATPAFATNPSITFTPGATTGAAPFTVAFDFTKLTQFSADNSVKPQPDGYASGNLVTFNVGSDGVITGIYSNGQQKPLGMVGLAMFDNPGGLTKVGSNLFMQSTNSGNYTRSLKPGSEGSGAISPGTLEMSNVDLSREFTDMITTQRGFQANSRVITTSDELLQELVNLKR